MGNCWDTDEDEDPPLKYSQNIEFHGQAFALYCKGLSCPQIADYMAADWPEANARTIQRMAKDSNWETARAGYFALHAQAQASAEGILPEVVLQLQRIRMQMESRVLLDPKDIMAYRKITEDLMWYTGKHPKLKDNTPLAVSNEADIAALLSAIAEDDVVGAAWKKRRAHIDKAYRERLKNNERENKRASRDAAATQRKTTKKAKGTKSAK